MENHHRHLSVQNMGKNYELIVKNHFHSIILLEVRTVQGRFMN